MLENFICSQVPLSVPNASGWDRTLLALEYQVWQACQQWKQLLPAAEVVRRGQAAANVGKETPQAAGCLVGKNIDPERLPTEEELSRMEKAESRDMSLDGRAGAVELQRQISDLLSQHKALLGDKQRLQGALASRTTMASGGRLTPYLAGQGSSQGQNSTPAVKAEPAACPPTARKPEKYFIDLTCDDDDEGAGADSLPVKVEPSPRPRSSSKSQKTVINLATHCLLCPNPPDLAMAVCDQCQGSVHAACLGTYDVPTAPFTCDLCENKASGRVPVKVEANHSIAGSAAVEGIVKQEARQSALGGEPHAASDDGALRARIEDTNARIAAVEAELARLQDQLEAVGAGGGRSSRGATNPARQRRSRLVSDLPCPALPYLYCNITW